MLHEQIMDSDSYESGKIEDAIREGFEKTDRLILQESLVSTSFVLHIDIFLAIHEHHSK